MNLLSLILKSMLSESSIKEIIKKTGLSQAALTKLLPLAIPLLLKFLTNNASSQAGATSLLNALTQHTSTKEIPLQLQEADTDDGAKIVKHILGSESDAEVERLALQSGLSSQDVSSVLAEIAPALMSSLSAATASGSSAGAASPLSGLASLFGSLMGGAVADQGEQDQSINGMQLLNLLGALR